MDDQRTVINDELLKRIAPLLAGKATDRGVTARDNRLFLEALLRTVRTGSPWRDQPDRFGKWNSQFRRFRRWSTSGVFEHLIWALRGDRDLEYVWLTAPLFRSTRKPLVQKGDSASGRWTISRRPEHNDRGPGGRGRPSRSLPTAGQDRRTSAKASRS